MNFVKNPLLPSQFEDDSLFHFGLDPHIHNLPGIFGDVKFVCCGGSAGRMHEMANYFYDELKATFIDLKEPHNLSSTDRYVLYKTGPILFVNHGIGHDSISIMLHEMLKLFYYAGCSDVTFFRCGTSGGVGIEPGTVVVTTQPLNGLLEPAYEQFILGKRVKREVKIDQQLAKQLLTIGKGLQIPTVGGSTISCQGFYEEQGRLNGALCEYTAEEHLKFLHEAHDRGVRNFEMESVCFASILNRANVKCAVLCVTLLNRLLGDSITAVPNLKAEWELRPGEIVLEYIKQMLHLVNGVGS